MAIRRVKLMTPQGEQGWRISSKKLARNQHTQYFGLCHWDKQLIEIDPRLDDETALRTIIHEPTHVALGRDYGEPAIERVEHNVYVAVCIWLKERYDIDIEES